MQQLHCRLVQKSATYILNVDWAIGTVLETISLDHRSEWRSPCSNAQYDQTSLQWSTESTYVPLFAWHPVWPQGVYTETAKNQNCPDQNGPQIFDMSKTAHIDVQNDPTQVQNGPELWLKRPTVELEVFLAPRVHYTNDVHWVTFREW